MRVEVKPPQEEILKLRRLATFLELKALAARKAAGALECFLELEIETPASPQNEQCQPGYFAETIPQESWKVLPY